MPDRLYVLVQGLQAEHAEKLANVAVVRARASCPKLSGRAAKGFQPVFGDGYFGVKWADPYIWYQESGTKPFTMRNLAGKVIPMWIDDPTGTEQTKNPKAKTRVTASGKRQVLIFRKVAKIGARKWVNRKGVRQSVPQSYPGAPGRIAHREWLDYPRSGSTGRIASRWSQPNIGVRWRNPGLMGKNFIRNAIDTTCQDAGLGSRRIQAAYRRF